MLQMAANGVRDLIAMQRKLLAERVAGSK
jgi:hypothetical protein